MKHELILTKTTKVELPLTMNMTAPFSLKKNLFIILAYQKMTTAVHLNTLFKEKPYAQTLNNPVSKNEQKE